MPAGSGGGRRPSKKPDDDEDTMEKDLADDAVWKRMQQNTFTRWANEHLKSVNKALTNLGTDFSDGIRLVCLVEVLSGKKIPTYNRRPKVRAQQLENVNIAIRFLMNEEKIRIVNIDSSDVVDGKVKLICGLMWTLILHYSISMPMWEGEDEALYNQKGGPTPKQRLLGWIQNKIPDIPVANFTTDWNDGRAIGALVDSIAPGLCPDWSKWKPENSKKNAEEAIKIAEEWLEIPQLIRPEEMVNPKVDELSMMTYLAQFPNAKLKKGAPTRQVQNPKRVRCYGPGIQPTGVTVGAPTNFTVETFSAGAGDVKVVVEDPKGKPIPCDLKFNDDKGQTYTCTYTAKMEGPHKISVKFAGTEVPKSPFNVNVEGVAGDPKKVKCDGPGLKPSGVQVGKPTHFDIETKDAGLGQVNVVITDPQGKINSVPCRLTKNEDDDTKYKCEYAAQLAGPHSVGVAFAGQPVPNSPFKINVAPPCDPRKVRATGRGLQNTGVRVGDIADFKIYTEGAGAGTPEVKVIGPGDVPEPVNVKKAADGTTYECDYKPKKEGHYVVIVGFGGQEIFRSPFEVEVGPYKESKIVAYGPGLVGGVVNHPARFTVDTNGEMGTLGFSVEGPSQATIKCTDNGDGSANVEYLATAPGEYAVHVTCNGDDIPKSPYVPIILPQTDYYPEKVEATGPGLQPTGLVIGKPTEFSVDTRKAGGNRAPVDVSVINNADYKPLDLKITDNKDGTYKVQYKPEKPGKHSVQINYGGVAITKSPFFVKVTGPTDPSKVKVSGPGVEKGVHPKQKTHFTIDTRAAGSGDVTASVADDKGKEVPCSVVPHGDGTYTAEYTAPDVGNYNVNVALNGTKVAGCPIPVSVTPAPNVSKVKVEGLDSNAFVNSLSGFTVDARAVPKVGDIGKGADCVITSPSGKRSRAFTEDKNDGTYNVLYTLTEEGPHKFDVSYDTYPVPNSPFTVTAKQGCDPSKVKAYGPGLQRGVVNQPNNFTIETRGAGTGGLGLGIEGPTEAKMTCKDNRDGTCHVEYVPDEGGMYDIAVRFADQHIPGSPFKVQVDSTVDPSKVTASGPGVTPEGCRAVPKLNFKVDATRSAKAPLAVEVTSEKGSIGNPEIKDNGNGTYDVSYVPPKEGAKCDVKVTHGGKDISGSPFKMKVRPKCEPKNVKLSGNGLNKQQTASVSTDFIIDAKDAGIGDLDVAILGPDEKRLKYGLTDFKDGTYKIRYVPEEIGPHKIIVKYGGETVPNCPIDIQSVGTGAANKCKIMDGPAKDKLKSGEECKIKVNAKDAGKGGITCRITRDMSKSESEQSSSERTEITPSGATRIIKETRSKTTTQTKHEEMSGTQLPNINVIENGDGTFTVNYQVFDPGNYTLTLKFGGQTIPGGEYKFTRLSHKAVTEELDPKKSTLQRQESCGFGRFPLIELHNLPLPDSEPFVTAPNRLFAWITMPSGSSDKPTIVDNHDGTISMKYDPRQEGSHELHIKYNNDHIQGSPFRIFVDSVHTGFVTAFGPGLVRGIAGEPNVFTIYTKGAGAGGLSVSVEGPSKAEINCKDNKDGTITVTYTPPAPGDYKINVKFGGKEIKGSPFSANVTGEGRKRSQVSVGHSSEVSLKVQEKDVKNLNASIVAPSGLEEPCFLKKLPNGHLGISFTPRESGEHHVNVKRLGNHINGSPFKINVLEREIGDATKVKVTGAALKEGKTQTDNEITIDTKNAGYGGLSLSIEGPSKADIQCKDEKEGTVKVSYKPTEPGFYIINLKFADHHVPGSPFTVKVTGTGSNVQREKCQKSRDAEPVTDVGSECKLTFKLPGTSAFDMMAKVQSPSGVTEDAEILDMDDCLYAVHFTPKEVGIHTVSIRCNHIHIPGSPFQFTVGPLTDFGSHRVHAGGPGLERGVVKESCEFNVWTREAGAGSLAMSVEGPSKAEIDFKDRKDGSCYVTYKVTEPGEYRVGVKFNDQHIPDSPFRVYIMPQLSEAKRIELGAMPHESNLQVNKPVTFTINMNGAKGNLDGKVIAPSGQEDDCFVNQIDDEQWVLRFVPKENGVHRIHIKFNGIHIPESPFMIKIGKDDADPAAVNAAGPGIKEARSGAKTDFIINTCNAGAGSLAVTIDGPSKVSMDCTEVEEGYKVRYTPLAPGEYFITVKYNGYHIVGSPFKVRCIGTKSLADIAAPEETSVVVETVTKQSSHKTDIMPKFKSEARRVECKGIGLKRAQLNRPNNFTVSACDAGNNMLFVALYGPKGQPSEEVSVKHQGRNNYTVTYNVRDRGEYILLVKWGDEHVPGSPFKVEAS